MISQDKINQLIEETCSVRRSLYSAALFRKDEKEMNNEVKFNDETWVWVTGYKGTNKDMRCKGYQYDFGKEFTMGDYEVKLCERVFHLCLKLEDVYNHYKIGDGNRFFEVKALVRKKDRDEYGRLPSSSSLYIRPFSKPYDCHDKLVAKSIEFIRELTITEIFDTTTEDVNDWTVDEKMQALQKGIKFIKDKRLISKLQEYGYSEPMAKYLVECCNGEKAIALGSQLDLSMETRIKILFGCDD